jgi:hypothetical protein
MTSNIDLAKQKVFVKKKLFYKTKNHNYGNLIKIIVGSTNLRILRTLNLI